MAGIADDANGFDVFYGDNVDFSGQFPQAATVTINGQLLIGSTAGRHIQVGTITSPLGTIAIGYSNPNITIDTTGGQATTKFQVDVITGAGTNPVVPTVAGLITVTGGQYATGTFGTRVITIDGTAPNTFAVQAQISSAVASTLITKNGISHFNSAQFTVDANGFVGLIGSGTNPPILGVHPNAISGGGTDPTVADSSGNISILGATVAAGTNPIRSVATAAHSITMQAQISQAIAAADATKIGLSAFNSADFTVDANGFVSTVGGPPVTKFTVDANTAPGTNPVLPDGTGNVTITGGQVAAGTTVNSIRTDSLAANTYTIQIQRSQAVAASTVGDNGVSHFSSADFAVDSNGFVTGNGRTVNWVTITASQTLVKNTGYFCISPGGALSLALPTSASSTIGDLIEVTLDGATSWTITQAAAQQIRFSSSQTTAGAGGSLASTAAGDTIRMVYQASGKWNILSAVGNLTVT